MLFFYKKFVTILILACLICRKEVLELMDYEYQEIYERYFKDVYLYVLTLTGNEDLAEEICQETFFKALKSIDKYKGKCKIYTWLCQIAKNTFYNHIKKESKNISLYDVELDIKSDSNIEENLILAEDSDRAHKILHTLKEPYKEVFTLRVFAELSFKQIGEIFSKSDSWARVVYYRAKNKIMEELK